MYEIYEPLLVGIGFFLGAIIIVALLLSIFVVIPAAIWTAVTNGNFDNNFWSFIWFYAILAVFYVFGLLIMM